MRKVLFILNLFPLMVFAQPRPKEGLWLTLNMPIDIHPKWQIHHVASYRTLGTNTVPLQYLYHGGLRYFINEKYSVAGGFSFFFTRTNFNKDNEEFGKEFRIWQEVVKKHSINKKTFIQFRFRTEQRFFEETKRRGGFTAHRFRMRINLNRELFKRWSLSLAHEYMQQYAQDDFVFDQNRLMTSMIYNLNEKTQVNVGYMWLLWPQESSQHLVNITFMKRFQLYGKNKRA